MSGMRLMRPHYVDPQTNIVYDTNSADYEGWLTKQSSWLKVRVRLMLYGAVFRGSQMISRTIYMYSYARTVQVVTH